jgi:DNA-binding CsgD family transcriptional regulator
MFLRRADLELVLEFLADVGELEFEELYPVEVLARLQAIVPCQALTYQDADLAARRFRSVVGISLDGDDDPVPEAVYWNVGPCPISDYRLRTDDLSAIRMSDLVGRREFRELPVYREYFAPFRTEFMIDLGLPAAPGRHRSFIFFRGAGERDFSDRDRAVLELLRPHLYRLEAGAANRRRLAEALRARSADVAPDPYRGLTTREREIVDLVAQGKTNSQIAGQLWVAPSTVKKHLEHVYEKLGVGRRTAAAALARPLQ